MERSDVNGMFAQSFVTMKLGVMNSLNEHGMAGIKCFEKKQFWKRMMIRYYSGKLMCTSLFWGKGFEKRYREGVMLGSGKEFQTHSGRIADDVKASN